MVCVCVPGSSGSCCLQQHGGSRALPHGRGSGTCGTAVPTAGDPPVKAGCEGGSQIPSFLLILYLKMQDLEGCGQAHSLQEQDQAGTAGCSCGAGCVPKASSLPKSVFFLGFSRVFQAMHPAVGVMSMGTTLGRGGFVPAGTGIGGTRRAPWGGWQEGGQRPRRSPGSQTPAMLLQKFSSQCDPAPPRAHQEKLLAPAQLISGAICK